MLLWLERSMFLPRQKTRDHLMAPLGFTDFTVEILEVMLQAGGLVSGMPAGIPMPLSFPVSSLEY
jgi:hypothetical protein